MMLSILDGDLEFTNGQLVLVEGAEEIRQHIEIRLGLWRGEAFYDVDEGADYRDLVLPAENRDDMLGELRRVVLGTPGVTDCQLKIETSTAEKITISGTYVGNTDVLNDIIRGEFGPVEIGG